MFWRKKSSEKLEPKTDILVTIIPDEYHIDFAGRRPNGDQVFVTQDLHHDSKTNCTTDYVVEYVWDKDGNILKCEINKIGIRGNYDRTQAAQIHEDIKQKYSDLIVEEIHVKPCSTMFENIEFGFIPRFEEDYSVVEVMPGNCLCFTEPFDGNYDT